jgi:hypothetical protein
VHGILVEDAAAYGTDAAPELIGALRDLIEEILWSAEANVQGIMRDPSDATAVMEWIGKSRGSDAIHQRGLVRRNAIRAYQLRR